MFVYLKMSFDLQCLLRWKYLLTLIIFWRLNVFDVKMSFDVKMPFELNISFDVKYLLTWKYLLTFKCLLTQIKMSGCLQSGSQWVRDREYLSNVTKYCIPSPWVSAASPCNMWPGIVMKQKWTWSNNWCCLFIRIILQLQLSGTCWQLFTRHSASFLQTSSNHVRNQWHVKLMQLVGPYKILDTFPMTFEVLIYDYMTSKTIIISNSLLVV